MEPSKVKAALRKQALERIAAAPATLDEGHAIAARIVRLPAFDRATVVSLFTALPGEPAADVLWEAARFKTICCPAMGPDGPELRVVQNPVEMKRTARGFFEPPEGAAIDPSRVDLFVVPGLAFDTAGLRLGRGGGYYDRLLARRRTDASTVGLAPDRLLVEALPRESHDIPMSHVATELRLIVVVQSPAPETLASR